MLVGSGMIARAFAARFTSREDVCVYAAGVSNSGCSDPREFERERLLLTKTLEQAIEVGTFVYFGTCSVGDPTARDTPYVQHKLAMERLVSTHPAYLILRLPQVAGNAPNPHTLLNFLYTRISRGEGFDLWMRAKRNIIDIDDVATLALNLIDDESVRNITANIANPISDSIIDIVGAMEKAIGKHAIYYAMDRGSEYQIDTSLSMNSAAVRFGGDYLDKVVKKYFGVPRDPSWQSL